MFAYNTAVCTPWNSLEKGMQENASYRIYLNKDSGCVIPREIDFLLKLC